MGDKRESASEGKGRRAVQPRLAGADGPKEGWARWRARGKRMGS